MGNRRGGRGVGRRTEQGRDAAMPEEGMRLSAEGVSASPFEIPGATGGEQADGGLTEARGASGDDR